MVGVTLLLIGYQLLGSPSNLGGPGVEPTATPEPSVAEPTPSAAAELDGPFVLSPDKFPITVAFTAPGVTTCTTAITPSSGPFDTATPVAFLAQRKWPGREEAAAWVNGIEARLIEAEAALQAGAPATMINTLNTLRTTVTGLAPLTDPGTAAGRVDLLFRERAFWLFSTGHRLGDLRRLMRQYGRTEAQVFPTGAWFAGASYGSDKNFPIPQTEENNPEAGTGGICIDRDA